MVCATSKASDQPTHRLEYSMIVELLTDFYLEFLSLKRGNTGSSESTLVKMPHCWKSHVTAHLFFFKGYSVFSKGNNGQIKSRKSKQVNKYTYVCVSPVTKC